MNQHKNISIFVIPKLQENMILKETKNACVAWWRCIGNNRNALEGVGHLHCTGYISLNFKYYENFTNAFRNLILGTNRSH